MEMGFTKFIKVETSYIFMFSAMFIELVLLGLSVRSRPKRGQTLTKQRNKWTRTKRPFKNPVLAGGEQNNNKVGLLNSPGSLSPTGSRIYGPVPTSVALKSKGI